MSKVEFDAPEMDIDDDEGIEEIENDYGDEDEGEIPSDEVRKILGRGKQQADESDRKDVKVSGPAGGKTVLGKQIRAKLCPDGLYKLYFKEGGELPSILQGRYTSTSEVNAAVDHYLQIANKTVAAA